jgi:hypothetical protein
MNTKPIAACPGYFVSDDGYVWSNKTGQLVKLKTRTRKTGYIDTRIGYGTTKKTIAPHVEIARAFLGYTPGQGLEVNHKNGNKSDNSLQNLELVTRSENLAHSYRIGLRVPPRGEASKLAKLSYNDVCDIRLVRAFGAVYREIAAAYGVSIALISHICNNRHRKTT